MQLPVFTDFTIPSESYKPEWLIKTIQNVLETIFGPATTWDNEPPAITLNLLLTYIVYISGFRRFDWDTISESPFVDNLNLRISDIYTAKRYLNETFDKIREELIRLAVEGDIQIYTIQPGEDGGYEYNYINEDGGEFTAEMISELHMTILATNISNIYISYKKLPPIT